MAQISEQPNKASQDADWLSQDPFLRPDVQDDAARKILYEQYGIVADLVPLPGERDQNFKVRSGSQHDFVLKIAPAPDASDTVCFQTALLRYLQSTAGRLSFPCLIDTASGKKFALQRFEDGMTCAVWVQTYVDGTPLSSQMPPAADWAKRVGMAQGQVCNALEGFEHLGSKGVMPWDAASPRVIGCAALSLLAAEFGDLITPHLSRLRAVSIPSIQNLPSQIIHNDLHSGNILADNNGEVTGVIDFGDALVGPIVQDIAVSATSVVEAAPDNAADNIKSLLHGFCSVRPLSSDELALLPDAMLLRSMLCVALGRLKDTQLPSNHLPRPATARSEDALRKILSFFASTSTVWQNIGSVGHK